jgi:hypothetical protein
MYIRLAFCLWVIMSKVVSAAGSAVLLRPIYGWQV